MRENNLLITTALDDTWLKNQHFHRIFLTEACCLFSQRDKWVHLEREIVPYHWNDRKKLKADHDNLKILYERILILLSENLNHVNNTNESVDYWRIIIGPWLINYISVIFDRWETIGRAFIDGKFLTTVDLPNNHRNIVAKDFDDFIRIIQTDEWNFQIYHRIISHRYFNQVTFKQIHQFLFNKLNKFNSNSHKKNLKHRTLLFADRLLKIFSPNPEVLIYEGYFSPISLAKLSFKLRQTPRMYLKEFSYNFSAEYDSKYRSEIYFKTNDDKFVSFFLDNISLDIPIAYLEAYKEINKFVNQIPLKPKKIVTANAYWGNDVFKFWLAMQKKYNKKIIISHHGGSLPPLFDTFSHEENIANIVVTWFKPYHNKHVQLPPNKLCGRSNFNNTGKYCSLLGFESPRFGYRVTSGPITNRVLDCYNKNIEFCEALSPHIQSLLKVRPYPDMGWQTELRFKEKLGASKIDSGSYKTFVRNSRLLVCTYPQTTFSEGIFSGKPVILVYIPDFNETIEEAAELIDILIKAKIVFNDSLEAANHVNRYWDKLEEWWDSQEVVYARQKFHDFALNVDEKWVNKWVDFFNEI